MGTNAWNAFVLRVEHSYIVGKSDKSLDVGEPTFHAEKTACYRLQQQTKVHVLALVTRTTLENCTAQEALNKGCSAQNQIISLTSSDNFTYIIRVHMSLSYPPPPPPPRCWYTWFDRVSLHFRRARVRVCI